jgi:transposase
MTETTRPQVSVSEPTLYVACELSKQSWKLALTSGFGVDPILRTVVAGDMAGVQQAIRVARQRLGLSEPAPVVSCYEAGRDGFWIHRALLQLGIRNRVVDSASIEVNRRARRAKTDRLDALKLVRMLARVCAGERGVWREVRVPSGSVEAARHVSRERTALVQEQTRLVNQMRGWLTTWGTTLPTRRGDGWWTRLVDWSGQPVPGPVQDRLARADARLRLIQAQLATLETQQQAAVMTAAPEMAVTRLVRLKGVATTSASVLLDEGLMWRAFRNRREIGGL